MPINFYQSLTKNFGLAHRFLNVTEQGKQNSIATKSTMHRIYKIFVTH